MGASTLALAPQASKLVTDAKQKCLVLTALLLIPGRTPDFETNTLYLPFTCPFACPLYLPLPALTCPLACPYLPCAGRTGPKPT